MKKKQIAHSAVDPTLPKTPVTIKGVTYNLCLTLAALAEAEAALIAEGHHEVNLLVALPQNTLSSTRTIFAAALRAFHPEFAFEDAKKLLTFDVVYDVALKIQEAWIASTPDPEPTTGEKPSDPPQPGE